MVWKRLHVLLFHPEKRSISFKCLSHCAHSGLKPIMKVSPRSCPGGETIAGDCTGYWSRVGIRLLPLYNLSSSFPCGEQTRRQRMRSSNSTASHANISHWNEASLSVKSVSFCKRDLYLKDGTVTAGCIFSSRCEHEYSLAGSQIRAHGTFL